MNRRFRVRIDWDRLREHLSREDAEQKTDAQVRRFLHDAGFRPEGAGEGGGDTWTVSEPDLSHLRPDEVTSAEPLED